MKKEKTFISSNLRKGTLAPLSNRMKATSKDKWICRNEGKYNVITANSLDTLVVSAHRNQRKGAPVKFDEPTTQTSQRKTRPMPC